MPVVRTVEWDDESVVLIDQRRLPQEETYLRCRRPEEVAAAIRDMAVRGAPAIGVTAALGIVLGIRTSAAEGAALRAAFEAVCEQMRVTRPTAVNLFWAIERMRRRFAREEAGGGRAVRDGLLEEAQAILDEDVASCHRMGDLGAALITRPSRVLTH
ncbi:MAG TPA: S-methyl-5-thioribose-1-phosphate isomerase, partial [Vicinamibacteria bacterium]|nr:S-methyl-5-thioribose-1-phosphate isomerase [Vicinamibacteria bacterium]